MSLRGRVEQSKEELQEFINSEKPAEQLVLPDDLLGLQLEGGYQYHEE